MPEANIVFTSVASIHPFCGENNLVFFFEELPLHYCVPLVGL